MQFNSQKIEEILGYQFKNKNLLKQAFTRSSYSQENGGLDNEILEFIGDKVIDYCIVHLFAMNYGRLIKDGYKSSKNEGYLTELKASLVDSKSLASAVDELKLDRYLIVGSNDKQNNVKQVKSVKEDLFEAIIGAVALDCDWKNEILTPMVSDLLDVQDYLDSIRTPYNPVGDLQAIVQKSGYPAPHYEYEKKGDYWLCYGSISDLDISAKAKGNTKKEARQNVALLLIDDFNDFRREYNEYFDVIGEPDEENALQQVNQLVQYGLISKPDYQFYCEHDEDGNPVWTCECRVVEVDEYYFHNDDAHSNGKKVAQRNAAYGLLLYLVYENDEEND